MTFAIIIDRVEINQHTKYIGQRSFRLIAIARTDTHPTQCYTWTTKVVGKPLKCSAIIINKESAEFLDQGRSTWQCQNHCPVCVIIMIYHAGRVHSRKRTVTVWGLSVCLSRRHTHCDSPGGSTRRVQRTLRPDNKEEDRVLLLIHLIFYCWRCISCIKWRWRWLDDHTTASVRCAAWRRGL